MKILIFKGEAGVIVGYCRSWRSPSFLRGKLSKGRSFLKTEIGFFEQRPQNWFGTSDFRSLLLAELKMYFLWLLLPREKTVSEDFQRKYYSISKWYFWWTNWWWILLLSSVIPLCRVFFSGWKPSNWLIKISFALHSFQCMWLVFNMWNISFCNSQMNCTSPVHLYSCSANFSKYTKPSTSSSRQFKLNSLKDSCHSTVSRSCKLFWVNGFLLWFAPLWISRSFLKLIGLLL